VNPITELRELVSWGWTDGHCMQCDFVNAQPDHRSEAWL